MAEVGNEGGVEEKSDAFRQDCLLPCFLIRKETPLQQCMYAHRKIWRKGMNEG